MPQSIDGMVLVASGVSEKVKQWSRLLRSLSIQYAIAHCHYDDPAAPTDHAELWVEKSEAEKARSAIRILATEES